VVCSGLVFPETAEGKKGKYVHKLDIREDLLHSGIRDLEDSPLRDKLREGLPRRVGNVVPPQQPGLARREGQWNFPVQQKLAIGPLR
jgi:hypothetical protein